MEEELLNYCVSLREEGKDATEILKLLREREISESTAKQLVRLSDQIFLDNLLQQPSLKKRTFGKRLMNRIILLAVLLLLLLALLGYVRLGLIFLILIWSIVRYLRYQKQDRKYFSRSVLKKY